MAVSTLEDEQNRLDGQIVSDEQIIDVQTGQTNFLKNKSSGTWLSGKTIFPKRFARQDEPVDQSMT